MTPLRWVGNVAVVGSLAVAKLYSFGDSYHGINWQLEVRGRTDAFKSFDTEAEAKAHVEGVWAGIALAIDPKPAAGE